MICVTVSSVQSGERHTKKKFALKISTRIKCIKKHTQSIETHIHRQCLRTDSYCSKCQVYAMFLKLKLLCVCYCMKHMEVNLWRQLYTAVQCKILQHARKSEREIAGEFLWQAWNVSRSEHCFGSKINKIGRVIRTIYAHWTSTICLTQISWN